MSTSQKEKPVGLWGGLFKGEFEESVATLERAVTSKGGNAVLIFNRLRTEPVFADYVAQAMLTEGVQVSTETRIARLLLGKLLCDTGDWRTLYEAGFVKKQLRQAAQFPWNEDVLNAPCPFNPGQLVKDTHFAFWGVPRINGDPLTVMKWLALHSKPGQPCFYYSSEPWYATEGYCKDVTLEPRWYLMLKDIVPGSTGKTPKQQEAMLPPEYELPVTIAEVTKDILVFRKTGERPNSNRWARCQEETSFGHLSLVGFFGERGLYVRVWSRFVNDGVGVGASRKLRILNA